MVGLVDAGEDGSSCTLPTRSSSGNAYIFLGLPLSMNYARRNVGYLGSLTIGQSEQFLGMCWFQRP